MSALPLGGSEAAGAHPVGDALSRAFGRSDDERVFVLGDADAPQLCARVLAGRASGSHGVDYTGHRKFGLGLDSQEFRGHNKYMSSYRVQILTNNATSFVGCYLVDAADKDAAKVEAIKAAVRGAKEYNAKYHASFVSGGVEWALRSENHDDYQAGTVRKAPVKRVAA
jgi:hypothetical protein